MALLLILQSLPAGATNGANLIAYSARTIAVGGADVAFVPDTSALLVNPSGLSRLGEARFDWATELLYVGRIRHTDQVGNDDGNDPPLAFLAGGGYAERLSESWTAGVGLFAAGGVGFGFKDLETGYGTRGTAETRFGIFRLAPGVAWAPTPTLSVGVSVGLNYAQARQKYFPDSSVIAVPVSDSLFGTRLDGLHAAGLNGIVGISWMPKSWLVLAAAYRSETSVDLHGGKVTVNFEAIGAGRQRYDDARLKGFALPQDLSLGFLARLGAGWDLMAEFQWIDWSTVQGLELEARLQGTNPNPLLVPQTLRNFQSLELRDQRVYSLGLMRSFVGGQWVAVGYNYARQPVPPRNLSPLLAIVPQRHFTAGWGRRLGSRWEWAAAVQYVPGNAIRYDNPTMRIARNATERPEALQINVTFGRSW